MINIFLFFHLNLSFSSIKVKDRKKIIEKCYWKILNIIEKNNIPIAIEMTGYTLSEINRIDKKWVNKFKYLKNKGLTNLIGSGYCQIIAPLCPAKINDLNLKIGNQIYKKILNFTPKTFHVNEQCFSRSLIDLTAKNKFKNIIMEFENPYEFNKNIKYSDKFYNHKLQGNKKKINLVWNSSVNFQKFQRYIYEKESEKDYLNFIKSHKGKFFCLYGSDGEVFDYRPKRNFQDEKIKTSEWVRIEKLLTSLKQKYEFVLLDNLADQKKYFKKSNLDLVSANMPCPTKKQEKYNINRWGISSHQNHSLNSRCLQIYKNFFKKKINTNHKDCKKLIYFFSSDFRTHIEKSREKNLNDELTSFENKYKLKPKYNKKICLNKNLKNFELKKDKESLILSFKNIKFSLNLKRFLSLNYFIDYDINERPLIGTLRQGFFKKIINYDVYSGHLIAEQFCKKITDISYVSKPKVYQNGDEIIISDKIKNNEINYSKKIIFKFSDKTLKFKNEIKFLNNSPTSIRSSFITINPRAFSLKNLKYLVKNGGDLYEEFKFEKDFCFGKRISNIVTSTTAPGFSDGKLILKDSEKQIMIENEHEYGYALPLIEFKKIKNDYLLRVCLSMRENDDTSRDDKKKIFKNTVNLRFTKLK